MGVSTLPQLIGDVWHLLFLINAFLDDCSYPVVCRIEVCSIGREAACLVWSPESCATATRCSCTRVVHWKAKVASSLTDVWQQLFEQQDIIMANSLSPLAAWKPYQCTSTWRHRLKLKHRNIFIRNRLGMSMSWSGIWLKYGHQPAELELFQTVTLS